MLDRVSSNNVPQEVPQTERREVPKNNTVLEAAGQKKQSFNDVWNQIQATMGAKPKEPRKIKKTLDKDDFMRIMMTQMQHQDPTKPFDTDKLAAEIAQIATVEQLKNVNTALKTLATQNRPLERLAMTNLIGKTVTVDRNRFSFTKGQKEALSFELPSDAKKVKVSIVSGAGEEIFKKELGEQPKGKVSFVWDGIKSNTIPADTGKYLLVVEATSETGAAIPTDMKSTAKIIGIGFQGEEPVLMVGDANHQERITMENVSEIQDGVLPLKKKKGGLPSGLAELVGKSKPVPQQQSLPNVELPQSKNVEGIQVSLDAKNREKAESPQVVKNQETSEKGFPNGMNVYQQQTKKGGEE